MAINIQMANTEYLLLRNLFSSVSKVLFKICLFFRGYMLFEADKSSKIVFIVIGMLQIYCAL